VSSPGLARIPAIQCQSTNGGAAAQSLYLCKTLIHDILPLPRSKPPCKSVSNMAEVIATMEGRDSGRKPFLATLVCVGTNPLSVELAGQVRCMFRLGLPGLPRPNFPT
jgi:hypothetical protein